MLKWSLIFFVVAIIAGIFGFTNIAEGAASIAKVLFFLVVIVWLIVVVLGLSIFKR